MATPKLSQEKIDELIKQTRAIRSEKHTTRTSFKKGHKPSPNAGRKKGVKLDPMRKLQRNWDREMEQVIATLILRLRSEGSFSDMSAKDILTVLPSWIKFFKAEMKSVESTETKIRKIEVEFAKDFGNSQNTIDIAHEEVKAIEDQNEAKDE